jgi:hypothetical protein
MTLSKEEELVFKNLLAVKGIVRRSENPHPVTIVMIIVVSILVMYCIYIQYLKKTITGNWVDSDDKNHNIEQNKMSNTIIVDGKYSGFVKGHLIVMYMDDASKMGIWIKNKITWLDGSAWWCTHGY